MSLLNTSAEKPRPYFESPFNLRWVRERWKTVAAVAVASVPGVMAIKSEVDVDRIGKLVVDGASAVNYFLYDMQELPLEPKLFFGSIVVGIPALLVTVAVQLRRSSS